MQANITHRSQHTITTTTITVAVESQCESSFETQIYRYAHTTLCTALFVIVLLAGWLAATQCV